MTATGGGMAHATLRPMIRNCFARYVMSTREARENVAASLPPCRSR